MLTGGPVEGFDAGLVAPAERTVVVVWFAPVDGEEVPVPSDVVVVPAPDPAPTAGLVAPPPTEPWCDDEHAENARAATPTNANRRGNLRSIFQYFPKRDRRDHSLAGLAESHLEVEELLVLPDDCHPDGAHYLLGGQVVGRGPAYQPGDLPAATGDLHRQP